MWCGVLYSGYIHGVIVELFEGVLERANVFFKGLLGTHNLSLHMNIGLTLLYEEFCALQLTYGITSWS